MLRTRPSSKSTDLGQLTIEDGLSGRHCEVATERHEDRPLNLLADVARSAATREKTSYSRLSF
jgi:hypothetical protein